MAVRTPTGSWLIAPIVCAQPLCEGEGEHAPRGLVAVNVAHIPAGAAESVLCLQCTYIPGADAACSYR